MKVLKTETESKISLRKCKPLWIGSKLEIGRRIIDNDPVDGPLGLCLRVCQQGPENRPSNMRIRNNFYWNLKKERFKEKSKEFEELERNSATAEKSIGFKVVPFKLKDKPTKHEEETYHRTSEKENNIQLRSLYQRRKRSWRHKGRTLSAENRVDGG